MTLADLERLEQAATRAWRSSESAIVYDDMDEAVADCGIDSIYGSMIVVSHAALIAAMRNALPVLLAVVKAADVLRSSPECSCPYINAWHDSSNVECPLATAQADFERSVDAMRAMLKAS